MQTSKVICPECELRALQAEITEERINEIVSRMAFVEGITTPQDEYLKRIAVCKECTSLKSNIMCSECGAYVAFRAHNLKNKCPFPGKNKWEF